MQYDVLLLDISNIFFRSYTALDLCTDNGTDISGLCGTLNTLQSQIRSANPTIVVGVFDGKGGPNKKRKLIPGYKGTRGIPVKLNYFVGNTANKALATVAQHKKELEENFLWQMAKLNEFLSYLPIYRVVVENYEADEILAYIAKHYFQNGKRLIVSADKDYHQLVTDDIHIWNFKELVTPATLKQKWGSSLGSIVSIIRAIEGDKSDEIHGIYGLSTKTICKYFASCLERTDIENMEDFKKYLETLREEVSTGKTKYAKNWKTVLKHITHLLDEEDERGGKCMDILERNYAVMQLLNPELTSQAKITVSNFLHLDCTFDHWGFKRLLLQENISIPGSNMQNWELQYNNLLYNQVMFAKQKESGDN